MPKVERNVVSPPNQRLMGINERRSTTPAAGPPTVREPNQSLHDGDPSAFGGNPMLGKGGSPVHTPDHRFHIEDAQMPQPQAAIMPGQGAVPVDLRAYGTDASGFARMDSARAKK